MAPCATSCCSARPGRSAPRRSTSSAATPDRFRVVGARRRRRPRRAARRAGARAGRRGGRRRQGHGRAGPAARLLRRGASGAATPRASSGCPKILAGPDAVTELAALAVRRRAQRHDRLARARARRWPRCAAGRTLALANKESLDRRRPAGQARWRGRARSSRSTPSTPRWRSACAAARRAEVRRLVLTASGGPFRGRTPRRAGRRHARRRRSRTRPGTWARSSRSTRRRW